MGFTNLLKNVKAGSSHISLHLVQMVNEERRMAAVPNRSSNSSLNLGEIQAEIEATPWYHEFDFPHGLKTPVPDKAEVHRDFWNFIRKELDALDFHDKSVLDLGCWDGYWSFYSEKRGASSVLASDDQTQNWAASKGLLLAKRLLQSEVETDLQLSVYDIERMQRQFDIILCLGLYYHLFDPFLAFAQIRHCCRPDSLVVVEGNAIRNGIVPNAQIFDPLFREKTSKFTPDLDSLKSMLRSAYLEPIRTVWMTTPVPPPPSPKPGRLGWRWRFNMMVQSLRGSREGIQNLAKMIVPEQPKALPPIEIDRVLVVCKPVELDNELHYYKAPFGLHRYDTRFAKAA